MATDRYLYNIQFTVNNQIKRSDCEHSPAGDRLMNRPNRRIRQNTVPKRQAMLLTVSWCVSELSPKFRRSDDEESKKSTRTVQI